MSNTQKLTKNQSLVLDVLTDNSQPMSAYSILDALRGEGLRAPPQIYRALDALMAAGNVHRLETLNAFVACSHKQCAAHTSTAFTICDQCGDVTELADPNISKQLLALAETRGFQLQKSTLELRGQCTSCRTQ